MKGFNYLSPTGFYDAVQACGLPLSLIKLDTAMQHDTHICIAVCTTYGLTDWITVSGVTKQGGPLSLLKSTLMTKLGHHWIQDLTKLHPEWMLEIRNMSVLTDDPHPPDNRLSLSPFTLSSFNVLMDG